MANLCHVSPLHAEVSAPHHCGPAQSADFTEDAKHNVLVWMDSAVLQVSAISADHVTLSSTRPFAIAGDADTLWYHWGREGWEGAREG